MVCESSKGSVKKSEHRLNGRAEWMRSEAGATYDDAGHLALEFAGFEVGLHLQLREGVGVVARALERAAVLVHAQLAQLAEQLHLHGRW